MLQNRNTCLSDLQRKIIFKTYNQIKKADAYGSTFEIFSPECILLKPTEFITINTRIQVQLPDEVFGLPRPMPTMETFKNIIL